MTIIPGKHCCIDGNSWLMFGELSISENPLATQGVVRLGVQGLSGNFTETSVVKKTASGVLDMSFDFTQSAAPKGRNTI